MLYAGILTAVLTRETEKKYFLKANRRAGSRHESTRACDIGEIVQNYTQLIQQVYYQQETLTMQTLTQLRATDSFKPSAICDCGLTSVRLYDYNNS